MPQNIAPGDAIRVKVVKQPTNDAARKTLVRLLSKDPAARKADALQRKVRQANFRTKQRGGRVWEHRPVKQRLVRGDVGETGALTATLDVLRDLASVQRFVEVTPA